MPLRHTLPLLRVILGQLRRPHWAQQRPIARVLANGTLALGPSGASSVSLGVGIYQVTFPSDVSKCVYTATVGDTPAGFPGPGLVVVTPRAVFPPDAIFVRTFAPNGVSQNNPFHIQVQC